MKSVFNFARLLFVALAGTLITGCLFKSATVQTHNYILTPIPADNLAAEPAEQFSVGIAFVKMPPELLRDSMSVRAGGGNEIEYLETALWAERLDRGFQRTLAANLSQLLPSDSVYLSDWKQGQVKARVFINVQQFDVDTHGRGMLIAQWRIKGPDSDTTLKSGQARLVRTGDSPRSNPEAIAGTLSDLTAEFSRRVAASIRESEKSSP